MSCITVNCSIIITISRLYITTYFIAFFFLNEVNFWKTFNVKAEHILIKLDVKQSK